MISSLFPVCRPDLSPGTATALSFAMQIPPPLIHPSGTRVRALYSVPNPVALEGEAGVIGKLLGDGVHGFGTIPK